MDTGLPCGTETILLVDDEEQIRVATTRILESLGYKILQAATPEQALHLATLSNAHLLLVDVVLPQMSGLTLAHKISAIRPGIHILYFSGYTYLPNTCKSNLRTGKTAKGGFTMTQVKVTGAKLNKALECLLSGNEGAARGIETRSL